MPIYTRTVVTIAVVLTCCVVFCVVFPVPRPESFLARATLTTFWLNAVPILYGFIALVFVLRRPVSATLLTVFACLAITLGSNFKVSVVSQPVVASDFLMFWQVVANPVLFEKYFREQWAFIAMLLCLLGFAFLAIRVERPLLRGKRTIAALMATGIVLLWQMPALLLMPSAPLQKPYASLTPEFDHFDPTAFVKRNGLFAALIASAGDSYFELPGLSAADLKTLDELSTSLHAPAVAPDELPNLVVVQNEAFFDFRTLDANFPDTAYASWDELALRSQHGVVTVDTYGGATLRTEFSVLTGIPLSYFGSAMDYPYLTAVNAPMDSLARHLDRLGYDTTAVHPYFASFWRRDLAYPRLGFDAFLSIENFEQPQLDGPYVSDSAVCSKILRLLGENTERPQFVFAVTMENHGPWNIERGQSGVLEPIDVDMRQMPDETSLQLRRYLYHARNATLMGQCLADGMSQLQRPGALLFFGDHAPAMPEVFAAFDVDNPWRETAVRRVPYLLWHSRVVEPVRVDLTVSELPAELLRASGVPADAFLSTAAQLRRRCMGDEHSAAGASVDVACPPSPARAMRSLAIRRLHPITTAPTTELASAGCQ